MPKNDKRMNGFENTHPEDLAAKEEKFRTFFSTSVAQVPDEMKRRDNDQKNPDTGKLGILSRILGRAKEEAAAEPAEEPKAQPQELPPTGEIRLGGEEEAAEPEADLELAADFFAPETPAQTPAAPEASPAPTPKAAAPAAQKPEKPAAPKLEKNYVRGPLTPQEQKEQSEMQELKALLFPETPPAKAEKPMEVKNAPQEVLGVETEALEDEEKATQPPLPKMVFAEDVARAEKAAATAPATPKAEPEEPTKPFRFFGVGDDENAPAAPTRETAPSIDDSMSLPLVGMDDTAPIEVTAAQAEAGTEAKPETAAPAPTETPAETPDAPAEAAPEEEAVPETPEQVGDKLHKMGAELTLRCVLSGILAVVLLHFGLVAAGLLAPIASLDPTVAPAAFYAANLLILAAELAVAYPVLRDGLSGLKKENRPSADTMPALAACGAALEAVIALLNAQNYQNSRWTLLSGIAALGLFMALLGSRVMLAAVQNGYDLATKDPEGLQGALRVKDKDLIRVLARSLDQKDPWVLLSRPVQWDEALVEQSFGERASERRARKTAYILLGASVLSGLVFLLFGGGLNGMAAAMAAMLCMGAPLSSTLVAGLASLRLQKTAAAAGAVVPGWAAIEELGGVDTVQVDADELFTADSVSLEDIRIFKGGRIDRAILYAASILNQSCETLRGLFRQIVEDRTDILYPVKDLEVHHGLGFAAWCDNNRILIGSRAYMEREGVPVPEKEYEDEHSKNGSLQILYLAVSGSLHAMFVLRYTGGRNAARGLEVLQRENIRLLVTCEDPGLTAKHITEVYHLPEGMITLLEQDQCEALAAPSEPENAARCCMLHDKGFVSLIGGLRAAEQAQNAETTATTVQLVSVWFSVAIGALLTYAGSIGTLSVAAVLMYQAAWSALSLAVCALKQHN